MPTYPLAPPREVFNRWQGLAFRVGPIESHMHRLICAVEHAIASGLYYSDEVLANVIDEFGDDLAPGDTERGKGRVEGGDFGMEVYYARQYLRECQEQAALREAAGELSLRTGMTIGSLVFNDFKLVTGCRVSGIDGLAVKIQGKRGRNTYEFTTNALTVKNALERAFKKGKRKSVAPVASQTLTGSKAADLPMDFGLFASAA